MNPAHASFLASAHGPRATRRFVWANGLLLLLFPWALYLVNDAWAYNHHFETAGIYSGYFLYWPDYLREFPLQYPGARLLWVAPGWLAYHLFSPHWANLLLRAYLVFGTSAALWLTLRRLGAGVSGATLGAMLLISNPYFLQAAGWDYVNGAGILCIAWSLYFLAAAATSPHRAPWLLAAGAAMIATVWTYLMLGVLAPVYAWFYLRQRGWPRLGESFRELGWLVLGAGAFTAFLGLVNKGMGGRFLFFLIQFKASKNQMEMPANSYLPPDAWLPDSPWLIVPCVAVLAGILLALPSVQKRWSLDRRAGAAGFALILAFIIFALVDTSGTWNVLHYAYGTHASYLLPFAILPLALVLDRHLVRFTTSGQMGVLCAAMCLLLLVYAEPMAGWLRHSPMLARGSVACIAICAALLAAVYRPTLVGLAALLLGLSWLNIGTTTRVSWSIPTPPDARDTHLLAFDVIQKITPLNADGRLMLWYHKNRAGPDRALLANYIELMGGFAWRNHRVMDAFPQLSNVTNNGNTPNADLSSQLHPGTRAVLLGDPSELPVTRAALHQHQLDLRVLRQEIVRHGDASIPFTVIQIEAATS